MEKTNFLSRKSIEYRFENLVVAMNILRIARTLWIAGPRHGKSSKTLQIVLKAIQIIMLYLS